MTAHTSVLHNTLKDFFLRSFFFFQGVYFQGIFIYILIIFVTTKIRKGHFHAMELHPRQLDQQSISNIMIQEIDSTK